MGKRGAALVWYSNRDTGMARIIPLVEIPWAKVVELHLIVLSRITSFSLATSNRRLYFNAQSLLPSS